MGSCCSTSKEETSDVTVSMFGLNGSGESTIFKLLRYGLDNRTPLATSSTVTTSPGYQVDSIDSQAIPFTLWDVGGARHIRKDWHHYYAQRDGFIFALDASNRERLNEAREVLHYTLITELEHANMNTQPLLILATKNDLLHCMSAEDIVRGLDLETIQHRQWRVFPVRHDQLHGLQSAMEWLLNEMEREAARTANESTSDQLPHGERKSLVENTTADGSPVSSGSLSSALTSNGGGGGGSGVAMRSHRAPTLDQDDDDGSSLVGGSVELGNIQTRGFTPRGLPPSTVAPPSFGHHHHGAAAGGHHDDTNHTDDEDGRLTAVRPSRTTPHVIHNNTDVSVVAATAEMARALSSRQSPSSSLPAAAAAATSLPAPLQPSLPLAITTPDNGSRTAIMSSAPHDIATTPLSPPLVLSPHGGRFGLTDDEHDHNAPSSSHAAAHGYDDVPLESPLP